jgi:iron complex outermembrane receptor protein
MRSFKIHRELVSSLHTLIRQRSPIGALLLAIIVAACAGPVKPVLTQESRDPSPTTETAEAPKPVEPTPSAPPLPAPDAPVVPLPPVSSGQPDGTVAQDEAPVLETQPVLVTAPRESYAVSQTATATRTDTPIMETPVNVQSVPQAVINDQQAIRLERAMQNVSGVYVTNQTMGQPVDEFVIRGFPSGLTTYRDWFPLGQSGGFSGKRDVANLERIEIVKGPASILFGRIEPGGLVNLVTKRPLPMLYGMLQQQFGSFRFYRTQADVSGPITGDGRLSVRLNMAYETGGSFREFIENERVFLAPVLQWNVGEKTTVTIELDHLRRDDVPDYGLPVLGTRPAPVSIRRNFGEATDFMRSSQNLVVQSLTHELAPNWRITQRFTANLTHEEDQSTFLDIGLDADGRTLNRFQGPQKIDQQDFWGTLQLAGRLDLWGTTHRVLLGGDAYTSRSKNFINDLATAFDPAFAVPTIDIFNPVHRPFNILAPSTATELFKTTQNWYGLFMQDHVELPFHLHLLAGFRYDNAGQTQTVTPNASFGSNGSSHDTKFTPRVGVLWRPFREVAFYGNYVENFGLPNLGLTRNATPLNPEAATQWELGAKTELWDGRLITTLAYFNVTKTNIAAPDPDPVFAALGFGINVGEARSRGVELDIAGEVLPGLLIGSYAYTDATVTKDVERDSFGNPGNQGKRLPGVPRHGGSLWATYTIQEGLFRHVTVGGGMIARSERQGDFPNSYQLPGYATVDLMAAYRWSVGRTKLTFQFNVNNLLDQEYYASSAFFRARVNPGAPQTFLGLLRAEFE